MFRYLLRTDGMVLEVSKAPTPKLDLDRRPKIDPATGYPVWAFELTAFTNEIDGSVILPVTVVSQFPPQVRWRDVVEAVDLEILPWAQKNDKGDLRQGISFRAAELRVIEPAQAA
jgi:hypothetical protein